MIINNFIKILFKIDRDPVKRLAKLILKGILLS